MPYAQFRHNALTSATMVKNPWPNHWCKEDIEKWVRREYAKHYPATEM